MAFAKEGVKPEVSSLRLREIVRLLGSPSLFIDSNHLAVAVDLNAVK